MPSKGKRTKKGPVVISPNKFSPLSGRSGGDSPCRVCNDRIHEPDGIQCDKCECWVHSVEKCSEISKKAFKFMQEYKSPAIIYLCSICITGHSGYHCQ